MKSKFTIRLIVFAALMLTLAGMQSAKAQMYSDRTRFNVGVDLGIPTGSINNYSSFALGATARLQMGLGSNVAFTATTGFYNFFGKTYGNGFKADDEGIVPLKAGVKAFFDKNAYFGAELGAGFETHSGGSTKLIVSPALGYATKEWDLSIRYENFSGQSFNYGMVAARLGYSF